LAERILEKSKSVTRISKPATPIPAPAPISATSKEHVQRSRQSSQTPISQTDSTNSNSNSAKRSANANTSTVGHVALAAEGEGLDPIIRKSLTDLAESFASDLPLKTTSNSTSLQKKPKPMPQVIFKSPAEQSPSPSPIPISKPNTPTANISASVSPYASINRQQRQQDPLVRPPSSSNQKSISSLPELAINLTTATTAAANVLSDSQSAPIHQDSEASLDAFPVMNISFPTGGGGVGVDGAVEMATATAVSMGGPQRSKSIRQEKSGKEMLQQRFEDELRPVLGIPM
jgi:hypothetical protein